jgi:hypothetical protein
VELVASNWEADVMDLDRDGAPARGLRRYVRLVAEALGVGPDCCYVQPESPVHAYIPLDDRLPQLPGSDVALTWDATQGWAIGVEDGIGPDVVPLSHLAGDPLPAPPVVVEFVTSFLAGERFAEPEPCLAADGDLITRLAGYASRFYELPLRTYRPHDRTTGNRGA